MLFESGPKMLPRFCKFKIKYIFAALIVTYLLNFFGAFTHIFEEDYFKEFNYPLKGNVLEYAYQIRHGQKSTVAPINVYNYTFLYNAAQKCRDGDNEKFIGPRLVIIVKSAMNNFQNRLAIRRSWGFERRFSDVIIRTVFILGKSQTNDESLQKLIDLESNSYNDIVQGDFVDTYFNNTIKTMMGFKWAVTYCPRSKFYLFVDDDYYVSTKNILSFIRNPVNYPEYLEEADETLRKLARKLNNFETANQNQSKSSNNKEDMGKISHMIKNRKISYLKGFDLSNDVRLFSGFVFTSAPHRHRSSKWYISLEEYPWHMWPPYVTAGSFILSREALLEMYYVSMFTKHFRFDDIFLGLVALKAQIELLHSEEFYFYKTPYLGPQSYKYVLASHGYDDYKEMVKVWTEVRAVGNA